MIEEFNVDWKGECGQLNLAHATKKQKSIKKGETKTKQMPVPTLSDTGSWLVKAV